MEQFSRALPFQEKVWLRRAMLLGCAVIIISTLGTELSRMAKWAEVRRVIAENREIDDKLNDLASLQQGPLNAVGRGADFAFELQSNSDKIAALKDRLEQVDQSLENIGAQTSQLASKRDERERREQRTQQLSGPPVSGSYEAKIDEEGVLEGALAGAMNGRNLSLAGDRSSAFATYSYRGLSYTSQFSSTDLIGYKPNDVQLLAIGKSVEFSMEDEPRYFKFFVLEQGFYTISAQSVDRSDPWLELLALRSGNDVELLEFDDDGGDGLSALIETQLEEGKYLLGVKPFDGASGGEVVLSIAKATKGAKEVEQLSEN